MNKFTIFVDVEGEYSMQIEIIADEVLRDKNDNRVLYADGRKMTFTSYIENIYKEEGVFY